MLPSAKFQAPPNAVDFLWYGEGVYHKQEYASFCVFYVILSLDNIILIYCIRIEHVLL